MFGCKKKDSVVDSAAWIANNLNLMEWLHEICDCVWFFSKCYCYWLVCWGVTKAISFRWNLNFSETNAVKLSTLSQRNPLPSPLANEQGQQQMVPRQSAASSALASTSRVRSRVRRRRPGRRPVRGRPGWRLPPGHSHRFQIAAVVYLLFGLVLDVVVCFCCALFLPAHDSFLAFKIALASS